MCSCSTECSVFSTVVAQNSENIDEQRTIIENGPKEDNSETVALGREQQQQQPELQQQQPEPQSQQQQPESQQQPQQESQQQPQPESQQQPQPESQPQQQQQQTEDVAEKGLGPDVKIDSVEKYQKEKTLCKNYHI